jgi:hypothetical protein
MERIGRDKKNLKNFAFSMCVALSVVGTILFLRHKQSFLWFYTFAVLILGLGIFAVRLLEPVYILWKRFAYILAWINTRIILALVFFIIFTPLGLIMRLFRSDPLQRKFNHQIRSYWKDRKKTEFDPLQYERQI